MFEHDSKIIIIFPLVKNFISFSQGPPDSLIAPVHSHLQGGGGGGRFLTRQNIYIFEHIFFLLAIQFQSKLKQDVNISYYYYYIFIF